MKMGKLYKTTFGNTRIKRDVTERDRSSSSDTTAKIKIYSKALLIRRIENNEHLSSEDKVKRIKALFPRDKRIHNIVDYEYNINHAGTMKYREKYG